MRIFGTYGESCAVFAGIISLEVAYIRQSRKLLEQKHQAQDWNETMYLNQTSDTAKPSKPQRQNEEGNFSSRLPLQYQLLIKTNTA